VINVDQMPGEYAVLTLARRHRLTVYDAAYLELALGEASPLATLDEALASAACAEGLSVIGGNPARLTQRPAYRGEQPSPDAARPRGPRRSVTAPLAIHQRQSFSPRHGSRPDYSGTPWRRCHRFRARPIKFPERVIQVPVRAI